MNKNYVKVHLGEAVLTKEQIEEIKKNNTGKLPDGWVNSENIKYLPIN